MTDMEGRRVWNPMSQQYEPKAPTLVEFLLARIAEEQADARTAAERADGDHLWVVTGMDNAVGVDYLPARVLAECKAKRRIIESQTRLYPEGKSPATEVLRLLALPYADHPDYREEWRS